MLNNFIITEPAKTISSDNMVISKPLERFEPKTSTNFPYTFVISM